MNRQPFSTNEWYHCYTRGVEKRSTFENTVDYERFLRGMYLANSRESFRIIDIDDLSLEEVLLLPRSETLVGIGAFCLMPNHFHIVLHQKVDGGVTSFMRKLSTAYTMYFNAKRERVGNLFIKPFRSRHIANDAYLQQCIRYVHCNPAELYAPEWKDGHVDDINGLIKEISEYPYSSLGYFENDQHRLRHIIDASIKDMFHELPAAQMIHEAFEYYSDTGTSALTR